MTNNHYAKTESRLYEKYYIAGNKSIYDNAVAALNKWRNAARKGHCFGMCAASILDKYGKIAFNENYGSGTTSISQVGAKPGTEQESALTYYHLAQYYDNLSGLSSDIWEDVKDEFNATVKKLQFAKGPALLSFTSSAAYSHAIIVNSCTWSSAGDRYYWQVYDPDTALISQWTIKIENGSYCLPNGEHILHINALANYTENGKTINELNKFDYLDIDGYQNLKSYSSGTLSLDVPSVESTAFPEAAPEKERRDPTTYSTIGFYLQDGIVIKNDRDEALKWSIDEGFTGDMEIYEFRPIIGNGPARVYLEVPLSETFTVESPEDREQYFTIVDQYRFQYADGFSGYAALHSNGAMELEGNLEEFEVGYYCEEEKDTQILSGKNARSVKIEYINGLLSAAGELEEYTVTKTDAAGISHTTVCTVEAAVEEASSSLAPEPEENTLPE